MVKTLIGEIWKPVIFDETITNDNRIEVSNFGRIRSFNKLSDGNLLNGSMINGYKIIRLKLFRPREEAVEKKLLFLQKQVLKLQKQIKAMKESKEKKSVIQESEDLLDSIKAKLKKKFADDTKKRTIHKHFLIHRLVAAYFLPQPKADQEIVAHLDFDKLNNRASNLKWMTREENVLHQAKSPHVIREKQERKFRYHASNSKLSVTRVMLLKKLLNEGKPIRRLAKQFKITDTQILRIKRGENWAHIEAAE